MSITSRSASAAITTRVLPKRCLPSMTRRSDLRPGGKVVRDGVLAKFGFNVKYLKDGKVQGQMMFVEHRATGDVVVKSNAMDSLSIIKWTVGSGWTAVIIGRSTVNGVGNYRFRPTVIDNGEPGANDKFRLQVTNSSGETVADLTFSPINLSGGNIQIP